MESVEKIRNQFYEDVFDLWFHRIIFLWTNMKKNSNPVPVIAVQKQQYLLT